MEDAVVTANGEPEHLLCSLAGLKPGGYTGTR
jgi:hypothetical protein